MDCAGLSLIRLHSQRYNPLQPAQTRWPAEQAGFGGKQAEKERIVAGVVVPSAQATAREAQQLVGTQIGQYEVISFLGRGGTAMVFKVQDLETGVYRALKITASGPRESDFHRFKREFRVMSRLAHPHVIAVYRYGIHDLRPYFVMELIEGRDLRAWLRAQADQPTYYERIAELFSQILRALGYIHDRHIIHRDLKPGNILVTHLGLAKVMDFGIAFELDLVAGPTQRQQTLMGTLAYVSPEQATGRKVDARSDLYSLGIILYELLTGVKPFTGSTISEVVYKHLHDAPRPPLELRPELPKPLVDLTLALLSKRPQERPQSAHEVLLALEGFLSGNLLTELDASALESVQEVPPVGEPSFVGRAELLEQLRARLARLRAGRGGLAMLIGDAGLGKSRLLEELARDEAAEGLYVFSSRCLAQATSPYQGFRDILIAAVRQLADQPGGINSLLSEAQKGALARAFPTLLPFLEPINPEEQAAHSGNADWLNLFTAVRTIIERLSEQKPMLLTFDDLDRADEASLALLQSLVRTLSSGSTARRVFLVGTSRPEALVRNATSSGTLSGLSTQLGRLQSIFEMVGFNETPLLLYLDPLILTEVEAMVSSMLGYTEDPKGLAEYLHQQSDGNPYFVEAILRALVEQGLVLRRDSSVAGCEWTLRMDRLGEELPNLALAAGLQGALRKRLTLLAPKDLLVLQVAATIGEPFRYKLLKDLVELDEDSLLDFLDRMLKAHILVERPGEGHSIFDFSHAKARELVLTELPRHEQGLLHRQVGQALAKRSDESLAASTAHHLYEGRLYDEALPFLLKTGERAVRQQLFRLSLRPLSQAEEVLLRYRVPLEGRDDTPLKLRLHRTFGVALLGLGRTDEAFAHLTQALTLLREKPELPLEAEIRTALGHVHRERGEYRAAREHYEEAMGALYESNQSHRMGDTILGLGEILCRQGMLTRAEAVYVDARELATELQHKPGTAAATLGLAEVALLQGYALEAQRRAKEALHTFRWLEDRPMMVQALELMGSARRLNGEYDAALESLEEAILMAREYDLRSKLTGLLTGLGQVYLDLNAPTQADGALTEAMTLCTRHGYIYHRAAAWLTWGGLKEQRDELSVALESYRQGLKLTQGIAAQLLTSKLLTKVASLQLRLQEPTGALRLIEKAIADLKGLSALGDTAEALLVLARVRAHGQDVEGAHQAVQASIALAEKTEARDLCFRALTLRMQLPPLPDGGSKNAGVLRAAGLLHWLLEGAGPTWKQKLMTRPDVAMFMSTHPALLRLDSST